MKKLLFIPLFLLAALVFFQACEKEQNLDDDALIELLATATDLEIIEPAQLPGSVRQSIEEMFFDTFMEDIYYGRGLGYRIHLGNELRLFFRENGDMLQFRNPNPPSRLGTNGPHGPCFDRILGFGRPVRPEALPQEIHDYIAENYEDAAIRMARADLHRIVVLVTGPIVLIFDREGNFVQEWSPVANCNPESCRPLPGNQLPAAARAYITENYPDATYRNSCLRGDRIAVFMINDGSRLILVFDRNGEFLFSRP